jgi:zinc/manganese transport system substrate-binding protein
MTRARAAVLLTALTLGPLIPAAAHAKLRVVATLPDLLVLTKAVTGDLLDVEVATRPGQNPHDMEIRPSQILLIKRADVLVRNGLEEDAWVDPVVEGSGNPKLLRGSPNVIEAVRGLRVLKVPTGSVDRSRGDIHPLGNPHYTLDPANIPIVTANIATGLSRLQPELAATFEANRTAFLEKLAAADRRWKQMLAPYRGIKMYAFHDSWPYFFQAFAFVEGGIIEDRPGIPPTPQHVATLIRQMKEDPQKTKLILIETWYRRDDAERVARDTGARVVVLPRAPGAAKGTDDYVSHIDHLVNEIAKALS